MTKNTSTPTNPPGSTCGHEWQTTTSATASARSAWISARTGLPPARRPVGAASTGLDADRRPVTPLLTWADGRAAAQARALRERAGELLARTGTPVHPMSPLVKIRWFHECEPGTAARVRWWAGLKDYLVYRLTGEL